jgi:hypothetical protein
MASRSRTLAEITNLSTQELLDLGFKKRQGLTFTRVLNEESVGRIGLARAYRDRVYAINPVIGVIHLPLEKLVAEIREKKFHLHCLSTISTPIGYLLPKPTYTTWKFAEGCDNAKTVKDMARKIKKYAIPFMESHSTFETMAPLLIEERMHPLDLHIMERIPAAYYLAGRRKMAEKIIKDELEEFEGENYPAAQDFRRYAKAFLKLLKRNS